MPTLEQRLACRERPTAAALMFQTWTDLLFAHWEVEPEAIQRTLPAGLTVDTHEGRAYVGVVPFHMRNIRPVSLPPLPWISYFLELNVRTYVHDARGVPGVWFYSLDCSQPLAVWLARMQFGLPYFHASMKAGSGRDGMLRYRSRRLGGAFSAEFAYRRTCALPVAEAGSLEFFLLERYTLYSMHEGRMLRGQVHHAPYPLVGVESFEISCEGLAPAGLGWSGGPDHVIASPGVDVEVFGPGWT